MERAVVAATEASRLIAELQDSMLPIEFGDPELRATLRDARARRPLPRAARDFLRTLAVSRYTQPHLRRPYSFAKVAGPATLFHSPLERSGVCTAPSFPIPPRR